MYGTYDPPPPKKKPTLKPLFTGDSKIPIFAILNFFSRENTLLYAIFSLFSMASFKVVNLELKSFPFSLQDIQRTVDSFGTHIDIDLQQRGVEFGQLFR